MPARDVLVLVRVPKLVPTKITSATTYHFRVADEHDIGWALATVNDETGELAIQSDWGNWAYRWSANPKHLGAPTLTHFLGNRGACHYLAGKLDPGQGPRTGSEFDVDETVKRLRRRLCEQRLEEARAWIEYYRGDDDAPDVLVHPPDWATKKPYTGAYYERQGDPLTRGVARSIWDGLGSLLECGRSADLFCERYFRVHGYAWLTDEPWEHLVYAPTTFSHLVLLHSILPALVEACRKTIQQRDVGAGAAVQP